MARIVIAARRFVRDEEGAAMAEYGILVGFIAIVSIALIVTFGSQISTKFQSLVDTMNDPT